jgi:hypothetical protein
MTNQPFDEPAEEVDHHPPFRMRSRSRLLLPDIAPPTRAEVRWAAEQRRIHRGERKARQQQERAERDRTRHATARVVELVPEPVETAVVDDPIAVLPTPVDDDWLIFPEVAGTTASIEPEPAPEPDELYDAEVDEPQPIEGEPDLGSLAPTLDPQPPAAFKPLALDAVDDVRPATFARLRSPHVAVPRPEWLDRGPLFDDADDAGITDLEPSLDLDFHDLDVAAPRLDEPAELVEVWAAARPAEPAPEPEFSPAPDPLSVRVLDVESDVGPDLEPRYRIGRDHWNADAAFDRAAADLAPWRPGEADARTADDAGTEDEADLGEADPPVVSHLLVVRDSRSEGLPRIAVLDGSGQAETVVLSRPPFQPADDHLPELDDYFEDHLERDVDPDDGSDDEAAAAWADLELPARVALAHLPATLAPDIEERYEPAPAVPKVWEGRPAPMFWRVLRLRHVRPNGWLRALFFEGSVALAVVLVLAGAANVWTIVVLPLVVAIIVKANDVLVGSLRRSFPSRDEVAFQARNDGAFQARNDGAFQARDDVEVEREVELVSD